MTRLPQSVRHQLAAQQQQENSHPDADLLTAFMENSLTAAERTSMLEHLARCPTCREVVAISSEQVQRQVAPQTAAPRQSFWNWAMLRWAAPALALVIVGAAVMLRDRSHESNMVPTSAPTAARQRVETSQPAEVQPRAEEPAAQVAAKPAAPAKESFRKNTVSNDERLADSPASTPIVPKAAPRREDKDGAAFATPTLGEPARSESSLDKLAAREAAPPQEQEKKSKQDFAYIAGAATPPPPPAATPERRASANSVQETSASDTSTPKTEVDQKGAANGVLAMQKSRTVAAAPAHAIPSNQGLTAGNMMNDYHHEAAKALVPLQWRIANGRLLGSTDGKTWNQIALPGNPEVTVVSTVGPQVWVGGEKGTLLHSVDSGINWKLIRLGTKEVVITDDIARIFFDNLNQGTVTTRRGQTWKTNDAGATWTRQ
jgi:hypothetical protein